MGPMMVGTMTFQWIQLRMVMPMALPLTSLTCQGSLTCLQMVEMVQMPQLQVLLQGALQMV
jgi:hypothetical protein